MSGGTFEYRQYQIEQLARDIHAELEKDYTKSFKPDTIQSIKEIADFTQLIANLVHAVDYLLAGDYSEASFKKTVNHLFKQHLSRGK